MTYETLCDIGDTVYLIIPPAKIILKEVHIVAIHITADGIMYEAQYKKMNVFNYYLYTKDLGNMWFFTREEAERKLNTFVYNNNTQKWEIKEKKNGNTTQQN